MCFLGIDLDISQANLKWDWWYLALECALDYFDILELFAMTFWLAKDNFPD